MANNCGVKRTNKTVSDIQKNVATETVTETETKMTNDKDER